MHLLGIILKFIRMVSPHWGAGRVKWYFVYKKLFVSTIVHSDSTVVQFHS